MPVKTWQRNDMRKQRVWSSSTRRQWQESLPAAVALAAGRDPETFNVTLLFSEKRVPGIYALNDKKTKSIGLFPLAARLSRLRRVETLVHETCHLITPGRHGAKWKSAMDAAAGRADESGQRRLAAMIRLDLADYDQREVDPPSVKAQLRLLLSHAARADYRWIRDAVADWAGFSPTDFERHHPWFRQMYTEFRR